MLGSHQALLLSGGQLDDQLHFAPSTTTFESPCTTRRAALLVPPPITVTLQGAQEGLLSLRGGGLRGILRGGVKVEFAGNFAGGGGVAIRASRGAELV